MVAVVPLHGDLDLVATTRVGERDDGAEERFLRRVQVGHEVDDPARVAEHLLRLVAGALVAEDDLEAPIQERHLAQPLEQCLRAELGLLHDGRVRPERDRGSVTVGVARALQRALRTAAVGERHLPCAAVAVDLEVEPARERVHDGDAHTVQTPGDLVALAAELPTGVQDREHDFGGRLVGVVAVGLDRDAAPVVGDPAPAVGEEGHLDARAVAGECLVDGVVDDLVDEVMEPGQPSGTDVHAGALADRFQPLEHLDVIGSVGHAIAPSECLVPTAPHPIPDGSEIAFQPLRPPLSGARKCWSEPISAGCSLYQTEAPTKGPAVTPAAGETPHRHGRRPRPEPSGRNPRRESRRRAPSAHPRGTGPASPTLDPRPRS